MLGCECDQLYAKMATSWQRILVQLIVLLVAYQRNCALDANTAAMNAHDAQQLVVVLLGVHVSERQIYRIAQQAGIPFRRASSSGIGLDALVLTFATTFGWNYGYRFVWEALRASHPHRRISATAVQEAWRRLNVRVRALARRALDEKKGHGGHAPEEYPGYLAEWPLSNRTKDPEYSLGRNATDLRCALLAEVEEVWGAPSDVEGQQLGLYLGLLLACSQMNPTYLLGMTASPLRRLDVLDQAVEECPFQLRDLTVDTMHELSAYLSLHMYVAHSTRGRRQGEEPVQVLMGRYEPMPLMVLLHYFEVWAYAPPPRSVLDSPALLYAWATSRAHPLISAQRGDLLVRMAIDWGLLGTSAPIPGTGPLIQISRHHDDALLFGKDQGSVKFVVEELGLRTADEASAVMAASRFLLGSTLMEIVHELIVEERAENGDGVHPQGAHTFATELRLLYDPSVIGPLSIFKIEHRCCEARALRNVDMGYVGKQLHRSHHLRGPAYDDVVLRKSFLFSNGEVVVLVFRASLDHQSERLSELLAAVESLVL